MAKKTIAVLTSGGDAPGMNTAVWAAAKAAHAKGMDIIGVRHGYTGLFPEKGNTEPDLVKALEHTVINIDERVADTMLGQKRY
jgi:6-phosphofructokinase 1